MLTLTDVGVYFHINVV